MKTQSTPLTRKEARIQIKQALSSLVLLQEVIGPKKFERRSAKVEKILTDGIPKAKKVKVKKLKEDSAA